MSCLYEKATQYGLGETENLVGGVTGNHQAGITMLTRLMGIQI